MTEPPLAKLPALGRAVGTLALSAVLLSALVGLTIVGWIATSIVLRSGEHAAVWALYMGLIVGIPAAMLSGIVALVGGMPFAFAVVPLLRRVGLAAGLGVTAAAAVASGTVALATGELARTAFSSTWSIPPLTAFGEWIPATLVASAAVCAVAASAVVEGVTRSNAA